MDSVNRAVKLIVGRAVARAYGTPVPIDDHADSCETCGGDGCHACFWTGQQSKVRL